MKKEQVIKKVVKKLALDLKLTKIVKEMIPLTKTMTGQKFVSKLKSVVEDQTVSNEDFSKIVEFLVRKQKLHLKDVSYMESLKELATKPPLSVYLKGLIF